jgi:hypothetical protein
METPVALEHEPIDNILEEPYAILRQIKDPIHDYSKYHQLLSIFRTESTFSPHIRNINAIY